MKNLDAMTEAERQELDKLVDATIALMARANREYRKLKGIAA